ncbi:MAG: putative toxin-antitoxin system toxin component, PIN family [Acidobacteriota bacterium]
MPKGSRRIKVVVDTNVFIGNFLSKTATSSNRRVIRMWLIDRALKLAISNEIQQEYLLTFEEILGFDRKALRAWRKRFDDRRIVDKVQPGRVRRISRDSKDDIFIAVAAGAKAKFLITNDRDLLDIDENQRRNLKFQIITPHTFVNRWDGGSI